jgi:hypothetical protein
MPNARSSAKVASLTVTDLLADLRDKVTPSFRDGAKHQTRNLEIPGSMLRIAPE